MPRRPKVKQAPSETYAARIARGKVPVSMSLPAETVQRLDALAERWGCSRSDAVARLAQSAE